MIRKSAPQKPRWRRAFSVTSLLACITLAPSAWPQSGASHRATSEGPLSFDVVAIRPSNGARPAGIHILPNGYQATGMSLQNTILIAYFPAPYFKHADELHGGPSWIADQRYDIDAKVAPADVARWQSLHLNMMQTAPVLQAMLQTMLRDRFRLAMHSAPGQTDGYILTVNRSKLALTSESAAQPAPVSGMQLPGGGKAIPFTKDNRPAWTFWNTSMSSLASFLALTANAPIEDKTGLAGMYHFTLSTLDSVASPSRSADALPSDPDPVVPLNIASLGLRLQRTKVPVTNWRIVSIQPPSAN